MVANPNLLGGFRTEARICALTLEEAVATFTSVKPYDVDAYVSTATVAASSIQTDTFLSEITTLFTKAKALLRRLGLTYQTASLTNDMKTVFGDLKSLHHASHP